MIDRSTFRVIRHRDKDLSPFDFFEQHFDRHPVQAVFLKVSVMYSTKAQMSLRAFDLYTLSLIPTDKSKCSEVPLRLYVKFCQFSLKVATLLLRWFLNA